jgi:hypothetical protein
MTCGNRKSRETGKSCRAAWHAINRTTISAGLENANVAAFVAELASLAFTNEVPY